MTLPNLSVIQTKLLEQRTVYVESRLPVENPALEIHFVALAWFQRSSRLSGQGRKLDKVFTCTNCCSALEIKLFNG